MTQNYWKTMAETAIRAIWFCFVGWWLGLLWISTAVVLVMSILGAPLGFVMLAKTGDIMFLSSSPKQIVNEVTVENNA